MLGSINQDLKNYRIILASASKHRRDLLKKVGLDYQAGDFEISPSNFAEDLAKDEFKSSTEYVMATA